MARETMATLRDEIARLQRESAERLWFAQIACDEASGIAPEATERFTIDDGNYELTLWRSTGAMAGIVRSVFRSGGQRAQVHVCALDSMRGDGWHSSLDYRIAIERLTSTRNGLLKGAV